MEKIYDYPAKAGWLQGGIKSALIMYEMSDKLRKMLEQTLEEADKTSEIKEAK